MSGSRIKKTRKIIKKEIKKRAREQSEAVVGLIYSQPWWSRAKWAYKILMGRR